MTGKKHEIENSPNFDNPVSFLFPKKFMTEKNLYMFLFFKEISDFLPKVDGKFKLVVMDELSQSMGMRGREEVIDSLRDYTEFYGFSDKFEMVTDRELEVSVDLPEDNDVTAERLPYLFCRGIADEMGADCVVESYKIRSYWENANIELPLVLYRIPYDYIPLTGTVDSIVKEIENAEKPEEIARELEEVTGHSDLRESISEIKNELVKG